MEEYQRPDVEISKAIGAQESTSKPIKILVTISFQSTAKAH